MEALPRSSIWPWHLPALSPPRICLFRTSMPPFPVALRKRVLSAEWSLPVGFHHLTSTQAGAMCAPCFSAPSSPGWREGSKLSPLLACCPFHKNSEGKTGYKPGDVEGV